MFFTNDKSEESIANNCVLCFDGHCLKSSNSCLVSGPVDFQIRAYR